MSARKQRMARERETTARPRSVSREIARRPVSESGLSVDPEDLAAQFLYDATEQRNFESASGRLPELSIVEGAPTDDAFSGPDFEAELDVWERTVDMALQEGQLGAAPETRGEAAKRIEKPRAMTRKGGATSGKPRRRR